MSMLEYHRSTLPSIQLLDLHQYDEDSPYNKEDSYRQKQNLQTKIIYFPPFDDKFWRSTYTVIYLDVWIRYLENL